MLTDAQNLEIARNAVSTAFNTFGGDIAPSVAKAFCQEGETNARKTNFPVIRNLSQWRKWTSNKVHRGSRAYDHTIELERWERTFDMDGLDYRYDNQGVLSEQYMAWVAQAQNFFDTRAFAALASNPTGYDGVPLFSDSHPHGPAGGVQDNYLNQSLSDATVRTALKWFRKVKHENGELVAGLVPRVLLVDSDNELYAKEIVSSWRPLGVTNTGTYGEVGASGSSIVGGVQQENQIRGMLTVISSHEMPSGKWAVVAPVGEMKPIICLWGRRPELIECFEKKDPERNERDAYVASHEADVGFGAGMWQTVISNIS